MAKKKANKKEDLKDMIPFDGEPNSESTIKKKGFDAPLLESGNMREHIDVFEEGRGLKGGQEVYTYTVKGNPDVKVTSPTRTNDNHAGINYEELLEILNNGTDTIPERPIFLDVWAKHKHGESLIHGITLKFEDSVRRRLR